MAVPHPCIACGHLIFLLTRLPVSVRKVLFDPDLAPHAAAMEAPLIICTVYGTLVPLLMALPLWYFVISFTLQSLAFGWIECKEQCGD